MFFGTVQEKCTTSAPRDDLSSNKALQKVQYEEQLKQVTRQYKTFTYEQKSKSNKNFEIQLFSRQVIYLQASDMYNIMMQIARSPLDKIPYLTHGYVFI